jgi:hypothetical protein
MRNPARPPLPRRPKVPFPKGRQAPEPPWPPPRPITDRRPAGGGYRIVRQPRLFEE